MKDEVYCESKGTIKAKGMAYPVTTYQVIGFQDEHAQDQHVIRAELETMTAEEISQAESVLRDALDRVCVYSKTGKAKTSPPHGARAGTDVESLRGGPSVPATAPLT